MNEIKHTEMLDIEVDTLLSILDEIKKKYNGFSIDSEMLELMNEDFAILIDNAIIESKIRPEFSFKLIKCGEEILIINTTKIELPPLPNDYDINNILDKNDLNKIKLIFDKKFDIISDLLFDKFLELFKTVIDKKISHIRIMPIVSDNDLFDFFSMRNKYGNIKEEFYLIENTTFAIGFNYY